MRLATLRLTDPRPGHPGTAAVRLDDAAAEAWLAAGAASGGALAGHPVDGAADVGALLADPGWRERAGRAGGARLEFPADRLAPVIPAPPKILCTGLNYARHIREMGHEPPETPTLFGKFTDALAGPFDEVAVPAANAGTLDFEGELAVIVGAGTGGPARLDRAAAEAAIAGYAVFNDYTSRGMQYRTLQWLQGKNLAASSGLGPWLTTAGDWAPGPRLVTRLNGAVMQDAPTSDLVHDPAALVAFVASFLPLRPGDVIATGTPEGVGHAREPRRYLGEGDAVEVSIGGLGLIRCVTRIRG